ncbi:YbfB/YjiJ family MFS transporter [Streptomyces sp. NPDC046977]|uniref:YbfB/YjiJ family MFS transporter n=1 Tax=Streptomyces sp. NPDC046977 TaxID=3154703 RepID=UPI0033FF154F
MHESALRPAAARGEPSRSPWAHVLTAAAALAAAMGVGRFVYTPILPLMQAQAGLTAAGGAQVATANYVGYLVGALAGICLPRLLRSSAVLRGCLAVLVVSLALMPVTHATEVWLALRLVAGAASALVFVIAVNSLHGHLRGHPAHLPGWAFGGVGAGIALSGLLVLALRGLGDLGDWRAAWWVSAALAAALSVPAWTMRPEPSPEPSGPGAATAATAAPTGARGRRPFAALFASYTLEGIGYIIAGTFLVAAVGQGAPGWLGSGAWVLVGLAAVPSSALWAALGRRWSRPGLLLTALIVQAVGIALPALVGGAAAVLVSALLFGATFLGVSSLALATGTQLRFPRAVALLTAGYSVGQIAGPLAAAPLLHHGYHRALVLAAVVVLAAAVAALVLRIGFPRESGTEGLRGPGSGPRREPAAAERR